MNCDILVFAPHPDDAEIHCGGTIASHVRQGARVVVVDASAGELASRGNPENRARETAAATAILGLCARECLALRDGAIPSDDAGARGLVIDAIRRYRPATVLCIHEHARHPDHQALARLVRGAIKAAGLHRLPSPSGSLAHGLARLWSYEAELPLTPDFLVPCTPADWQVKCAAIACYHSQISIPAAGEPHTSISAPEFLAWIDARGRTWGYQAGAAYAEAFSGNEAPRLKDLRGV